MLVDVSVCRMRAVKEMETDGELNASKVLLDSSSLAHSAVWEEREERNRLIMTCEGNCECLCTPREQIFLSWRRLVLVGEKFRKGNGY